MMGGRQHWELVLSNSHFCSHQHFLFPMTDLMLYPDGLFLASILIHEKNTSFGLPSGYASLSDIMPSPSMSHSCIAPPVTPQCAWTFPKHQWHLHSFQGYNLFIIVSTYLSYCHGDDFTWLDILWPELLSSSSWSRTQFRCESTRFWLKHPRKAKQIK